MALALRPLLNDSSMKSRYRSQTLPVVSLPLARSVDTSLAGFESGRTERCELRCCGLGRGRGQLRAKVGGHLVGRFCRWLASAPAAWRTDGDAGSFEIGASRFAPYARLFLDSPQRPTQPA